MEEVEGFPISAGWDSNGGIWLNASDLIAWLRTPDLPANDEEADLITAIADTIETLVIDYATDLAENNGLSAQ